MMNICWASNSASSMSDPCTLRDHQGMSGGEGRKEEAREEGAEEGEVERKEERRENL